MKLRKILALLVALTMAAAVLPGFGLTASAKIVNGQGIVTSSNDAYAAASDDLIADGGFETDEWESALTTGAYVDSAGGDPGFSNVIKMNTDPYMADFGAVAFERVEGRTGYGISPAFEAFTPDAATPRYTNDANGPTSIKHYIHNSSKSKKTYYVSFWAKAVEGVANFRYYIGSVGVESKIPSSQAVAVGETWTQFDAVVDLAKDQYLIINIFDMNANSIVIDDVEACEVTISASARDFAKAAELWPTSFPYYDGQVISENIKLPATVGKAKVTYTSSDNELLNPSTGAIANVGEDTPVNFTATLAVGTLTRTYEYRFIIQGYTNRIKAAVQADGFVKGYLDSKDTALKLPATVPGFEGSKITWTSSDESIIAADGTYNHPDSIQDVTLTATVLYNGDVITADVVVRVGLPYSIIENGSFEIINGNTIPGWTTGTGDAMTTTYFDYKTEANGNRYIVSKEHEGFGGAGTIRTYIDLEPGKLYNLSYKIWYNGDGTSDECYTGAYLVSSRNTEAPANINTYGGYDYPRDTYHVTSADGWQTITVPTLRPDKNVHTLLISGTWLNRRENGHSDGRWAFDDFVLEEVESAFMADVTINYLDENGEPIIAPRVEKNTYGNLVYYATDADKADINLGGIVYRYDAERSVDNVLVSEDSDANVINLYFRELIDSYVTIKFVSRETGEEIAMPQYVMGYVGFEYTAADKYKVYINGFDGNRYVYDDSSVDTIMVSENEDDNIITLYFIVSDNAVVNGDFTSGITGWENRLGRAIEGYSINWDDAVQGNVLSFTNEKGSTGGKDAADSIGTIWNVNMGKEYRLEFDLYGTVLTENNYQYNKISDTVGSTNTGTRDAQGTIIYEYGKEYAQAGVNQWRHMTKDFTATTTIVYFQSSYFEGFRLANVKLKEIDASKVGNVVIHYVDSETNDEIKAATTVEGILDGTNYVIPDDMKADFEQGGYIYKLDAAKSDKGVTVKNGQTHDLYLYFIKASAADVTINFIDRATGNPLKLAAIVTGTVGQPFTAGAEYKATIAVDGVYYVYDKTSVDTINVSANAAENVINLYFIATNNMIENGDFESALDGTNIPGWGTGTGVSGDAGVAQMTTAHFDYKTDADGNHYIQSKGSQQLHTAGSLKRFIDLEPGKTYSLSFKVKRATELGNNNAGYKESWISAVLVKDDHAEMADNNMTHDQLVAHRQLTGSFIPETEVTPYIDMITPTVAEGWVTTTLTLTPTEEYKTLLIAGKWLDAGWCFDDFMLTEINTEIKGSVTINYLNGEVEGTPALKDPKVVEDLIAGTVYTVSDEDKASITVDGVTYFFDAASSNTSITVAEGDNNVINLIFKTRAAKSVEDIVIDTVEGSTLVLPETADVAYTDGSVEATAIEWNEEEIPAALVGGQVHEITGKVAGLDIKATVKVFYKATAPEGYEDATWVGGSVKYPAAEDATNLIADGTFADGVISEQWTDALGSALSANFKVDTSGAYSKVGNSIYSTANGGGSAAGTMRTYFPVEPGKSYVLSYDVYAPVNVSTNGPERMSANALTRANYFGNYDNYGGELYLDFTVTGGNNSWSPNAYSTGNSPRVDMPFYKGFNEVEHTFINVPEDAQYLVISHAQNVPANPLYFSNFQLYEIAADVSYKPDSVMVKVTLIANDETTVTYVEKGAELPDYAAQYPGYLVTVEGTTDDPEVVVTVGEIPVGKAAVSINASAATVAAEGATMSGTLVIAQYNAENGLVKVQTTDVTVPAGAAKEVKYQMASDAVEIKAMLLESITSLVPVAAAASYKPGDEPAPPVDEKPYLEHTFMLQVYGTDQVLTAGSRPLTVSQYTGSDLQKWALADDYFIMNLGSKSDDGRNQFMDISGWYEAAGTSIGVWTRDNNYGDLNQQWVFEFDGDGYYIRSEMGNKLYLTIVDGNAQQQPKELATKWVVVVAD